MDVHLKATAAELRDKADELIETLSKAIAPANPELAHRLEKSLPPKETSLKLKALRDLKKITDAGYAKMLRAMNLEIGKVLDRSAKPIETLHKSKSGYEDYTQELVDKDNQIYVEVQIALEQYGYKLTDYLKGGQLYGESTNQLRERLKELRKS